MLNLKYKKTTGVVIAMLILSIVFVGLYCVKEFNSNVDASKVSELRALYKTYDNSPPDLLLTGEILTMDYYAKAADLIIVGEIVEELEKYKANPANIGTPEKAISDKLEKNGVLDTRSTFSQARVKVLDTIKGDKLNEVIIIRNSEYDDYYPPFTPGQKAVLFLGNGGKLNNGNYFYTKKGYYFVTEDNLVVSAVSFEAYNKYTGMKLDRLKSVITSLIK